MQRSCADLLADHADRKGLLGADAHRLIQNLMVAPVSIVCMRLILPRVVSAVNALYGGAASAAQK